MEMPPPAAGTQDAGVTAPTQGVTGVKSGVRSATMPIQSDARRASLDLALLGVLDLTCRSISVGSGC